MVGPEGWVMSLTDSVTTAMLESTSLSALRNLFQSDFVHLMMAAADARSNAALRGRESIEGKPYDAVDFASPAGPQRFLLDPVTHRVVAIDTGLGEGPVWHVRRRLSDYHLVEGVLLPLVEDRMLDGVRDSHVLTRVARVNGPVDMTLFVPPTRKAQKFR
jgi:hypothetical protein